MIFRSALMATSLLVLSGCAAVQPERSFGRGLDDTSASLSIKSAMLRAEGYVLQGIDVEVTEGIALLTGTAPREDDRLMAECLPGRRWRYGRYKMKSRFLHRPNSRTGRAMPGFRSASAPACCAMCLCAA